MNQEINKNIQVTSCLLSDRIMSEKIFAIRTRVFVDEQKVSRAEEFDVFESSSIHYLGLINNQPAGTARWRITEKGIKLERFAVEQHLRNTGIGRAVLEEVLRDVVPLKKRIYLHAQVTAVGFYEKAGFVKEGAMFSEANIEHFVMTYAIREGRSRVI